VNVYRVTYESATGIGDDPWATKPVTSPVFVVAPTAEDAVTMVMAPMKDRRPERVHLLGVLCVPEDTFAARETRRAWEQTKY
jgi:hypothetical protein